MELTTKAEPFFVDSKSYAAFVSAHFRRWAPKKYHSVTNLEMRRKEMIRLVIWVIIPLLLYPI